MCQGLDEESMQQMQSKIEELIGQFEGMVNNRIEQRQIMISELKKI